LFEKPQFRIETIESGLNYGRYKVEPLADLNLSPRVLTELRSLQIGRASGRERGCDLV
jgi:hypothetical protein